MPNSNENTQGAWGKVWRLTILAMILAAAAFVGTSCTEVTSGAASDPAQAAAAARGLAPSTHNLCLRSA